MNEYKADKQTAEWLKQNGWDEKSFTVIELPFLQAQQVAHSLMKYHAALLMKRRQNCSLPIYKTLSTKLNDKHSQPQRHTKY